MSFFYFIKSKSKNQILLFRNIKILEIMFLKNKFLIVHYFLVISIHLNEISQEQECCLNSTFAIWNRNRATLTNFEKFSQLKFNCNSIIDIYQLDILPTNRLVLDESLNLNGLRLQLNFFLIKFIVS